MLENITGFAGELSLCTMKCQQPLSGICTSANRAAILTNIGKTVLITKRKTRILELWYFVAKDNLL